jgi:SAM-dependent methyltransferase
MSSAILGYMHGTGEREQQRLSRLNLSLNDLSIRELALVGGERVIDFGCGLGQLTRMIAKASGSSGYVMGFDASVAQLEKAKSLAAADGEDNMVEFRHGDVTSPPLSPDEVGTFDVAHARFVLEHVIDPGAVVKQMARALRPGGRLIIQDDDHAALRVWPEPGGFLDLWNSYILVCARNQNDPFVGRRLPSLLVQAETLPLRNGGLFYGGVGGSDALRSAVENIIGLFDGVIDPLLHLTAFSAADYASIVDNFREWAGRPGSALWYTFHWAEAVRR